MEIAKRTMYSSVTTEQIGVWQLSRIKSLEFDPRRRWNELICAFQLFCRLAVEISSISYPSLILFILSKLWYGAETAMIMHLSSSFLQIVCVASVFILYLSTTCRLLTPQLEVGLRNGDLNCYTVAMAIVSRLSCSAIIAYLNWWTNQYNPSFKSQVIQYYEAFLLREQLKIDLTSAQDPDSRNKVSPMDAWDAFNGAASFVSEMTIFLSQIALLMNISRTSGGPIFSLLCVARPVVTILFGEDLWSEAWFVSLKHEHYQRMMNLVTLTSDTYRQDIISNDLSDHILDEYKSAKGRLGNTCTDNWDEQMGRKRGPTFDVLTSITGDLPMVYCAACAVLDPSSFTLASIAILQQSSQELRWCLSNILRETQSFQRYISNLRNMYAISEKLTKVLSGDTPYPHPKSSDEGMSLELRDVVFEYPGSKNGSPALDKVSLNLKPGQLAVIVGENGSGKSTIINLLTRMYEPTSGSFFIDGLPSHKYRSSDLRRTMATFTQDHRMFPLSLYENIAFGDASRSADVEAVKTAAKQGGAAEFINKFNDGLDTLWYQAHRISYNSVPEDPEHPLRKRMKALERNIDISGGEKQRLVAARTFMHLGSGRAKFAAIDEPSSALDPEAELQLFNRLIANRAGKTMVFVTHRFGHLTKHADIIICMKDGRVAESGSHEELMKLRGEYAKLYEIQADAFVDGKS